MRELKTHIKILSLTLLLPLCLSANTNQSNGRGSEADNIIVGSSYGDKTIDENSLSSQQNNLNQIIFKDEVILNWISYFETDPKAMARAKDVVAKKTEMIAKVVESESNATTGDSNAT